MSTETRGLDLGAMLDEFQGAVSSCVTGAMVAEVKSNSDDWKERKMRLAIARNAILAEVERLTALGAAPGEPCAWMVEDGAPEVFRYEDVARAHAACTGGRVVPPYRRAEAAVPDAEGRK